GKTERNDFILLQIFISDSFLGEPYSPILNLFPCLDEPLVQETACSLKSFSKYLEELESFFADFPFLSFIESVCTSI
ncbi:hypothetical protein, partial [Leptospira borgpetersenii]|uniref:hypothetical protein n=1 Tax=Leptospira borgpetersenii TaxID=174 RepID=UPI001D141498